MRLYLSLLTRYPPLKVFDEPEKVGQYGVRLSNIWFGEDPPEDNTKLWAETGEDELGVEQITNLYNESDTIKTAPKGIIKNENIASFDIENNNLLFNYNDEINSLEGYSNNDKVFIIGYYKGVYYTLIKSYDSTFSSYTIKAVAAINVEGIKVIELGSVNIGEIIDFIVYDVNDSFVINILGKTNNSTIFGGITPFGSYIYNFDNINPENIIGLKLNDLGQPIIVTKDGVYSIEGILLTEDIIDINHPEIGLSEFYKNCEIIIDDDGSRYAYYIYQKGLFEYGIALSYDIENSIKWLPNANSLTIWNNDIKSKVYNNTNVYDLKIGFDDNSLKNISNITSTGVLLFEGLYDNEYVSPNDKIGIKYAQIYINGIRTPFRKYNPDTGVWERLDNFFGEE